MSFRSQLHCAVLSGATLISLVGAQAVAAYGQPCPAGTPASATTGLPRPGASSP